MVSQTGGAMFTMGNMLTVLTLHSNRITSSIFKNQYLLFLLKYRLYLLYQFKWYDTISDMVSPVSSHKPLSARRKHQTNPHPVTIIQEVALKNPVERELSSELPEAKRLTRSKSSEEHLCTTADLVEACRRNLLKEAEVHLNNEASVKLVMYRKFNTFFWGSWSLY